MNGCRGGGITFGDLFWGSVNHSWQLASLFFLFSDFVLTQKTTFLVRPNSENKSPGGPGAAMNGCRGGGIRTPGSREGSPVFETGTLSHSVTPLLTQVNYP